MVKGRLLATRPFGPQPLSTQGKDTRLSCFGCEISFSTRDREASGIALRVDLSEVLLCPGGPILFEVGLTYNYGFFFFFFFA